MRYIPHGWNTALGLAADLQLAAALPDSTSSNIIGGSAYVDELTAEPFRLDEDGYLPIADNPGLGVELDHERVARYTPDAARFFEG